MIANYLGRLTQHIASTLSYTLCVNKYMGDAAVTTLAIAPLVATLHAYLWPPGMRMYTRQVSRALFIELNRAVNEGAVTYVLPNFTGQSVCSLAQVKFIFILNHTHIPTICAARRASAKYH